jgi:hypothetical protein
LLASSANAFCFSSLVACFSAALAALVAALDSAFCTALVADADLIMSSILALSAAVIDHLFSIVSFISFNLFNHSSLTLPNVLAQFLPLLLII